MPRKKKPLEDPAEQSARFIEAARQLESDVTGKAFARAFKKIVPKKQRRKQAHKAQGST